MTQRNAAKPQAFDSVGWHRFTAGENALAYSHGVDGLVDESVELGQIERGGAVVAVRCVVGDVFADAAGGRMVGGPDAGGLFHPAP
jgi:hypothetical protein